MSKSSKDWNQNQINMNHNVVSAIELTEIRKDAMTNIIYFGYNYPHDFIEQAFKHKMGTHLRDHIKAEFRSLYETYGPLESFFRFFLYLSGRNREILLDYIEGTYHYQKS